MIFIDTCYSHGSILLLEVVSLKEKETLSFSLPPSLHAPTELCKNIANEW